MLTDKLLSGSIDIRQAARLDHCDFAAVVQIANAAVSVCRHDIKTAAHWHFDDHAKNIAFSNRSAVRTKPFVGQGPDAALCYRVSCQCFDFTRVLRFSIQKRLPSCRWWRRVRPEGHQIVAEQQGI